MKKLIFIIFILFYSNLLFADLNDPSYGKYFYIGKMQSHHNKFTLYFKTREKLVCDTVRPIKGDKASLTSEIKVSTSGILS